jgi:hypothetical protein
MWKVHTRPTSASDFNQLRYSHFYIFALKSIGWASDHRLLVESSNQQEFRDNTKLKKDIGFAVNLVSLTKSLLCKSITYFHLMQDLPFLLNSNKKGRDVLASYKKSARLSQSRCNDMMVCIVEHFYSHSVVLQVAECQIVAEKIVKLFPTENVDTYISKIVGSKACSGRLYGKSRYYLNKIKKLGFNPIMKE